MFLLPCAAQSRVLMEMSGVYLSDTLNASSNQNSSQIFYNFGVLFSVTKTLWAGWDYLGISTRTVTSTTDTYSTADTGPYMKWQIDKAELYSVSAAYHIQSKAQYATGDTKEKWDGTSLWGQFTIAPDVGRGLHIGLSLNYYSATYTRKVVDGTESTDTNTKSWIFPSVNMSKEW